MGDQVVADGAVDVGQDDDDESNFLIQRWTMIEMSGQDSLDCASSDD